MKGSGRLSKVENVKIHIDAQSRGFEAERCETVSQPRVRIVPHQPHFPVKKSLNLVKSYSWAPNMFWVTEVWTSELNIIMLVIVCEFSASPASLFSLDRVEICPERQRIPKVHLQFKHLPSRKLNDSFKGAEVTATHLQPLTVRSH